MDTTNQYPILVQPVGLAISQHESYKKAVGSSTGETSFEKLRDVENFYFETSSPIGRVDVPGSDLVISSEDGQKLYLVRNEIPGKLKRVLTRNTMTAQRITRDFNEDGMTDFKIPENLAYSYRFQEFGSANEILTVELENGNMIAKSKGQPLGVVYEDKWYKTPNFTASGNLSVGNSSFYIKSTKGYFSLNWIPCLSEAEFRITSSGIEVGVMSKVMGSDSEEHFSFRLLQNVEPNSKALLLVAAIRIYTEYFGKTMWGSYGTKGACCSFNFI